MGKASQFRFFWVVKGGTDVFPEPTGSQLPVGQNNPHAK